MAKSKDALSEMHDELTKQLLNRIKSGEATAADLSVARQFLKDNGIQVANLARNKPLMELADTVPFTGTDD